MPSILRFSTAGSVDDGKSSLIGRLLYDSKSIHQDQLAAIERASQRRGSSEIELALLTDGLRAEREQNITIDVAYRYFSTQKRKFIVADTPGHEEYTRNMVTGASTVDLSVILVDARKGVLPQTRRHAAISALLGIPQVVVAVNKMDLVDFDQERFNELVRDFEEVASLVGLKDRTYIPLSALLGDNVVGKSRNTPWYRGKALLPFLESVEVAEHVKGPLRLPIQYVIRPNQDFRGLAGRVARGQIDVGESVMVLPTGLSSSVVSVFADEEKGTVGRVGDSVTVQLAHDLDASRGSMLVSAENPPDVTDRFDAVLCWLGDEPLVTGGRYVALHTTQRVVATVEVVHHRLEMNSLTTEPSNGLAKNDIGKVRVRTSRPIFADTYADCRATGSFVLVEFGTNRTVAGGMIQTLYPAAATGSRQGSIFWLSTLGLERTAEQLIHEAKSRGEHVVVLSEESLAETLNVDSPDWHEVLRRILSVAQVLQSQGIFVVVETPLRSQADRELVEGLSHVRVVDHEVEASVLLGEVGGL